MLYVAVYLQSLLYQGEQVMTRRLREERGALSAEYVALIVAVTAILGFLAAGPAKDIAQAIADQASKLIKEIGN